MAGSPNEGTRETRRCWWAKRANSPRAWLAGVRASVVAEKRVTTVEPRDAGKWMRDEPERRLKTGDSGGGNAASTSRRSHTLARAVVVGGTLRLDRAHVDAAHVR